MIYGENRPDFGPNRTRIWTTWKSVEVANKLVFIYVYGSFKLKLSTQLLYIYIRTYDVLP